MRESTAVPVAALILGCGAAVSLCVSSRISGGPTSADPLVSLLWLIGWALVVWAALVALGYAVHLVLRAREGRHPVLLPEVVLTTAALLLVGAGVAANPLLGSGSGSGSG